MKLISAALVILFVLQSCNKNRIKHTIFTNVWELTSSNEEYQEYAYIRMIEYYDTDGMIIEKKYIYKTTDDIHYKYAYNENNQLTEFDHVNSGKTKYYYNNDMIIKKEFYSSEDILSSYSVYEYSNSLVDKIKRYDKEDNLLNVKYYYYTANRPDSTYHCVTNQTDSIYKISRYSYDDINNTMEENIWQETYQSPPTPFSELIYYSKIITGYDNEHRIIRTEDISQIITDYRYIREYEYDSYGKMIKETIIFNDDLLGYYTANYSDEDKNNFIIPEH